MDDDLKQLVQKNLELTERIVRDIKKMRHHFWMANVWSILKITVFIVIPIFLTYRYLTPYMGQLQSMYQQVLELQKGVSGFTKDIGEVQKNIKGLGETAGKLQDLQKQLPAGGSLPSIPNIPGLEFLFKK